MGKTNTIPYLGNKRVDAPRLLGFLGGGEVLRSPMCGTAALALRALEEGRYKHAVLGDLSPHVMAMLVGLKEDWEAVKEHQAIAYHKIGADRAALKEVQAEVGRLLAEGRRDPEVAGMISGARARCFSGIIRVSKSGSWHTSIDDRGRPMTPNSTLERYGRLLQQCTLFEGVWRRFFELFMDGEAFVDPPYLGKNGHRDYTKEGWTDDDASDLALHLATEERELVVLTEQEPGGAQIYQKTFLAHRFVRRYERSIVRNCNGKQKSKKRTEVALVCARR